MKRKILVILLVIMFLFTGCSKKEDNHRIKEDLLEIDYNVSSNETQLDKYDTTNPVAAMYIKGYGTIIIELYKDIAPNTVNNFVSLVKSGFYDNNTMHRLVPGFVLQGGDPTGTGTGGPDYTIKGEFSQNGISNNLKHEKGIVSMARSQEYDSAGSQFFIMLDDASHLDGGYAAFGRVIDGWKNIENIVSNEKIANQESGKLQKNLIIEKTLIDLKNNKIEAVEKIS